MNKWIARAILAFIFTGLIVGGCFIHIHLTGDMPPFFTTLHPVVSLFVLAVIVYTLAGTCVVLGSIFLLVWLFQEAAK